MKFIFLINKIVFFSILIYNSFSIKYEMEIKLKNDELDKFNIIDFNDNCDYTIPSLFSPIILSEGSRTSNLIKQHLITLNNPIFKDFTGYLYKSVLDNSFWCVETKEEVYANCYFGLSFNYSNSTEELKQEEINLNLLNETHNRIFSFDKWKEVDNNTTISSSLYYGENHDDFTINKGIKGSCNLIENEPYWGCFFDSINFENETMPLISKETGNNYNIFFSSENNEIIFPTALESPFLELTKGKCHFQQDIFGKIFYCDEYFENKTHLDIVLSNKDINITLEIDNLQRYNLNEDEDEDNRKKTRIYFTSENDIILPMIMFKNFHVQFDAENRVINFFTTDSSILKVKTKEKDDDDDSSDSNGLTIFLVILAIVISIAIVIAIVYFIKKRYGSNFEKDINKFSKFEDEETEIKPMSDKRVF